MAYRPDRETKIEAGRANVDTICLVDKLLSLHAEILACRACEEAGYIDRAAPVVAGRPGNRIMLIGQAPGITELSVRRPFAGRSGRVLFGWLKSIGIDEDDFRNRVYMTAITKCYPGRVAGGTGDRRPSTAEIALCRPFLQRQLALVRPYALLLVGGMAIERFLPKVPLVQCIGSRVLLDERAVIPLPHPSGASRWLNIQSNRLLLTEALHLVREEWDRPASSDDVLARQASTG